MRGPLILIGVLIATGDLWLGFISWRQRSVLGGLLGAIGITVVVLALLTVPTQRVHEAALLIAAIMLAIGFVLYGLGQTLQRLLDEDPDDP